MIFLPLCKCVCVAVWMCCSNIVHSTINLFLAACDNNDSGSDGYRLFVTKYMWKTKWKTSFSLLFLFRSPSHPYLIPRPLFSLQFSLLLYVFVHIVIDFSFNKNSTFLFCCWYSLYRRFNVVNGKKRTKRPRERQHWQALHRIDILTCGPRVKAR